MENNVDNINTHSYLGKKFILLAFLIANKWSTNAPSSFYIAMLRVM